MSSTQQAIQLDGKAAEKALLERINSGQLIEDLADMTPRYRAVLERTLAIAAQGEVTVLTWAQTAFRTCPDLGAKIAVAGSIQDEVGHAHQQGMLWERFGFSMQEQSFEVDPNSYWSLPIMEFPISNYVEFVVAQAFLDRAGRFTTWDIELHCSFAPYRRTLRKVNFEEAFHFRHGAMWTEYFMNFSEETKQMVKDAVKWIFPWGYHWYGRPDHLKGHPDQLTYGIRKWTNDTMRGKWLKSACLFAQRVGLEVPAHFNDEAQEWVFDEPFPMLFDRDKKEWIREESDWDTFINEFKIGGPMRPAVYERLQREEWGSFLWQS